MTANGWIITAHARQRYQQRVGDGLLEDRRAEARRLSTRRRRRLREWVSSKYKPTLTRDSHPWFCLESQPEHYPDRDPMVVVFVCKMSGPYRKVVTCFPSHD